MAEERQDEAAPARLSAWRRTGRAVRAPRRVDVEKWTKGSLTTQTEMEVWMLIVLPRGAVMNESSSRSMARKEQRASRLFWHVGGPWPPWSDPQGSGPSSFVCESTAPSDWPGRSGRPTTASANGAVAPSYRFILASKHPCGFGHLWYLGSIKHGGFTYPRFLGDRKTA